MAKYSKKAGEEVKEAMLEMKKGKLKIGRSGKKVTSPKQAIAIGLSEAREKGTKVPKKTASKTTVKSASKTKRASSSSGKTRTKSAAKSTGARKSTAATRSRSKSK